MKNLINKFLDWLIGHDEDEPGYGFLNGHVRDWGNGESDTQNEEGK